MCPNIQDARCLKVKPDMPLNVPSTKHKKVTYLLAHLCMSQLQLSVPRNRRVNEPQNQSGQGSVGKKIPPPTEI